MLNAKCIMQNYGVGKASRIKATSDEGAGFCEAKDWGRENDHSLFSPYGPAGHLPRQREALVRQV